MTEIHLDAEKEEMGFLGKIKDVGCTMSNVGGKPELVCSGDIGKKRVDWTIPLEEFEVK